MQQILAENMALFQSHFKSISVILVTQILKSPKGCTPETSSCNVRNVATLCC